MNFSLHHRVHTGTGAHPASYPMGTRGSFADHSPPSSAEVNNEWSCTSTSQYASMAWCLIKQNKHRDFTQDLRCEVLLLKKIQVEVFLVVTLYSYVVGHLRFGGLRCFHLHGVVNGALTTPPPLSIGPDRTVPAVLLPHMYLCPLPSPTPTILSTWRAPFERGHTLILNATN